MTKAIGVDLPENYWNEWIEYKARRDVIVHNSGIINQIYINKSGDLSIGIIGDRISFNDLCFRKVIADLKSFVGQITKYVKAEYNIPSREKGKIVDI